MLLHSIRDIFPAHASFASGERASTRDPLQRIRMNPRQPLTVEQVDADEHVVPIGSNGNGGSNSFLVSFGLPKAANYPTSVTVALDPEGCRGSGSITHNSSDHTRLLEIGHRALDALGGVHDRSTRPDERRNLGIQSFLELVGPKRDVEVNPEELILARQRRQFLISPKREGENPEPDFSNYKVGFGPDEKRKRFSIERLPDGCDGEIDSTLVTVVRSGKVDTKILDKISESAFDEKWSDLRVGAGSSRRKVLFLNDTVGLSIPIFEIDPVELTKVNRHEVTFLIEGKKLVIADGTSRGMANEWLRKLPQLAIVPAALDTPATIVSAILESCVAQNGKIVDHLDDLQRELQEKAASRPLTESELRDLTNLEEALGYMARKINEMRASIEVVGRAMGLDSRSDSARLGSSLVFDLLVKDIERLSDRLSAELRDSERVRETHRATGEKQINVSIRKFTILVGLTAPPIIADFIIKMGDLEHHKLWIFGGSFLCSAGLIAAAKFTRWLR